jgi:hypothetical protein
MSASKVNYAHDLFTMHCMLYCLPAMPIMTAKLNNWFNDVSCFCNKTIVKKDCFNLKLLANLIRMETKIKWLSVQKGLKTYLLCQIKLKT